MVLYFALLHKTGENWESAISLERTYWVEASNDAFRFGIDKNIADNSVTKVWNPS